MEGGHPGRRRTPATPDARTRTAYHEAGHAVLSAALGDMPRQISIRGDGHTLGRSGARMPGRTSSRLQIHLAGLAAEHLLTGVRPVELDQEVGFAILGKEVAGLGADVPGLEERDASRAVSEILRVSPSATDEEIRAQVERSFEVACDSLRAVWSAVQSLAAALLEHEELDRVGVEAALGDTDLFTPVFAVQQAQGLLLPEAAATEGT